VKIRVRKKHVVFGLVVVLGLALIAVEVFLFTPGVRVASVGALERTGSWDSLVGLLDDDSQDVRAAASEALIRHGSAAAPALAHGLDRLSERGRGLAAFTLGRIGPDARAAIPALKHHMIADETDDVREAAATALGLVARDDPAVVAELLGLLETGDDAGRIAAARAVPGLGETDRRRAVPQLIQLLKHPNPRVREAAADALGGLGADARPAVPALIDALADPDPKVRGEAAEALENYLHGVGMTDPELAGRANAALGRFRGLPAPGEPPRQP
jgi:HEAT repeat protein